MRRFDSGCRLMRKWNEEKLREAIRKSKTLRQAIAKLKLTPAGDNYDRIKRAIIENDIDTSHFEISLIPWNKGGKGERPRTPLTKILKRDSTFQSYKLKKRLFQENIKPRHCEECGWAQIAPGGYLPLELDHINGDRHDNRLENLRVLCPNCHSLKPTHRGKNKGPGWRNGKRAPLKMA